MNKIFHFFHLIVLGIGLLTMSCHKKQQIESEDIVFKSYRLIDENKTDEAIDVLSARFEELNTPQVNNKEEYEMHEVAVALASAYAKKAGVTFKEIMKVFDIAKIITEMNKQDSEIPQDGIDVKLNQFNAIAKKLYYYNKVLQKIPQVSKENIIYLEFAIQTLHDSPFLNSSDFIYRIILNFILFRSILSGTNLASLLPKERIINGNCAIDLSGYRNGVYNITEILINILKDALEVTPKSSPDFEKIGTQIKELATLLANLNSGGTILYHAKKEMLTPIFQLFNMGPTNLCNQ